MSHADYHTALKNGIDAARSGSRMMARLHLLKAADYAPDEVASHLWLAWVAETPADALIHLDEALSRKPQHGLAQIGRLWTRLMSEFDPTKDYTHCDVSSLSAATPTVAAAARAATAPAATPAAPRPASPFGDGPLDLTRTVRMDLVRRPRGDEVDDETAEASPALTCILPPGGLNAAKPGTFSNATPSEPTSSSGDEEITTGTIRLDANAVKRALAESVIAELTTVESSGVGDEGANVVDSDLVDAASVNAVAHNVDTAPNSHNDDRPPIDEYTEPPAPALSPDMPDEQPAPPDAPALTGPRVLVVDDSPTVRKLVASTLESRGYRVACAASGYEAVEILSQATPDALVIEIDLPRLDGLHLCKLLRSQDATRHTPVIFLTRRSGTMDRMRGKMVGATAYLTKPFRSVALIEELSTCCPSN